MLERKLFGKIETLPEAVWQDFSNEFAPSRLGRIGLLKSAFGNNPGTFAAGNSKLCAILNLISTRCPGYGEIWNLWQENFNSLLSRETPLPIFPSPPNPAKRSACRIFAAKRSSFIFIPRMTHRVAPRRPALSRTIFPILPEKMRSSWGSALIRPNHMQNLPKNSNSPSPSSRMKRKKSPQPTVCGERRCSWAENTWESIEPHFS